jgi:ElaB/YqjD/DUF883 family membrane-anchored ribosome-binding protein
MNSSNQDQNAEEIVTGLLDELNKLNQGSGSRDVSQIHEVIIKKERLLKELREFLARRNNEMNQKELPSRSNTKM